MTSNSPENEENSDNKREETLLHRTKGHLQKEFLLKILRRNISLRTIESNSKRSGNQKLWLYRVTVGSNI